MSTVAATPPDRSLKSSRTSSALAVDITDLHKSFKEQKVLKGISLSLSEGSVTALLGINGSGKSTLLRSIGGMIPIDSGEVKILNTDISRLSKRDLRKFRRRVGFIFQKHNLVPRLSSLSNVLHGALGRAPFGRAWYHSLAPQELREEAFSHLLRVGLGEHAAKQTRHLSGGQSQRVAIARALMQNPEIILADEPVASLDPEAGDNIMQLLRELSVEKGITLLFTTHHIEHALLYADRIIGLENGVVHFDGASDEFEAESLRRFYER